MSTDIETFAILQKNYDERTNTNNFFIIALDHNMKHPELLGVDAYVPTKAEIEELSSELPDKTIKVFTRNEAIQTFGKELITEWEEEDN